ncbi:signal recognition particle-docking protein FtsY [Levilactobacillus sp. HBUAS70063]|uniref:signal recognition particle-docking protein FtsY n=1 Tax=Levilactobacillus sp. HBUAS70063 TaxID=3109359 RepID=UPI003132B4BD
MGLFDIFRRRAKKEPASEAPQSAASSAATETSTASSAATTTPSSSADVAVTPASAAESTAPSSASVTEAPASSAESSAAPTPDATSEAAVEPTTPAESMASSAAASPANVATSEAADEAPQSVAAAVSPAPESVAAAEPAQPESAETPAEAPVESAASSAAAESTPAAPDDQSAAAQPVSDEQLYDKGLAKTRHTFGERLNALLANFRHVDESFFDDLEETLIGADVGFDMAVKLSDELRDEVKLQNAKKSADVQNVVVEKLVEIYDAAGNDESTALNMAKEGPTVILFVGVNGVGKTTTIGKMANRYHQDGKKVLLAAADTFRAGATEQLDVWAKRADVDIVTGKPQSDPAAVVFDAVQKAKREDYDILFVDTAGRLQNKVNLMNELAKMKRIITREIPTAPHEVLLVLDATTGQNALTQAKLFKESTDVTGIVLTKLDGTARGGIVLAIRNELHVPVKFIGLGEQISDLRPFDPNEFVYGLFKGLIDVKALEK